VIISIGILDGLLQTTRNPSIGLQYHKRHLQQMPIETGQGLFLSWDAPQPEQQSHSQEDSHADDQLEVGEGNSLDGHHVGPVGDCLRLLVDLEHVDKHLVQLYEGQLPEVVTLGEGRRVISYDILLFEVLQCL
jgi:hypothetical protein